METPDDTSPMEAEVVIDKGSETEVQQNYDTEIKGGNQEPSVCQEKTVEGGGEPPVDPREVVPDIKELTIKNLDTGEEFIIGENDPDFEFDTFEIRGSCDETVNTTETGTTTKRERQRIWYFPLLNYLYGAASSKKKTEAQDKIESELRVQSSSSKPKTPFTKLSSFKFRKELGRGAFGRVLLAEAKTDGKLYALKIVSKKNMRSSDKRQAKAERDILHAMTLKAPHPFTSGLKFAFQSENNLYLGLDYIPGGNLRELIKRFKCLPESWVQMYAAELVLAISHLHSLNVLYRDIKPHNVMIDARGHLVLIDFGLSKQEISHPRGALSLVGTPDYSAPEVLKTGVQQIEANNREKASTAGGRKKKIPKSRDQSKLPMIGYGKAADWWSLGIMIYEMLSGTPTFRGADLRQTYQKILYADLEFVPEEKFSSAARSLLSGLIKRDPSLRLGAWENPPQDIMGSPFFIGIQWDAIYERARDGPWVPEVQVFSSKTAKSGKTHRSSTTTNGNATGSEPEDNNGPHEKATGDAEGGEYAGFDAVNNNHKSNNQHGRRASTDKQQSPSVDGTRPNDHESSSGSESDSGSDDGEDDEDDDYPKDMRDSVFILSRGQLENKLADWSFIDEQVLRSTMEAAGDSTGEESPTERRKRRHARKAERQQHHSKAGSNEHGIPPVPEGDEGEEREAAQPVGVEQTTATADQEQREPAVAAEDRPLTSEVVLVVDSADTATMVPLVAVSREESEKVVVQEHKTAMRERVVPGTTETSATHSEGIVSQSVEEQQTEKATVGVDVAAPASATD